MKDRMRIAGVVGSLLGIILLGLIAWSAMPAAGVECEVCVTYQGRTECRKAKGTTEEETIRTAKDNACALLTSGMSDVIACGNVQPSRVTCGESE